MNERDQRIVELRTMNPTMTLGEIGFIVGEGKQRVHQILKENHSPTSSRIIYDRVCSICEEPISYFRFMHDCLCVKCKTDVLFMILKCDICNKIIMRRKKANQNTKLRGYRHTYCSSHCRNIASSKILSELAKEKHSRITKQVEKNEDI